MDYGEILSRAWRIIWKHKILWIFGIMAGCSSGGGGNSGGSYRANSSDFDSGYPGEVAASIQRFFDQIGPEMLTLLIIAGVCLVLGLIVLGVFLGITGRVGLIRGTLQAEREAEPQLRFGELFRGSLPFFWRQFLLGLLMFVLILGLILIGILVAVPATLLTFGFALLCLIPLICLLIPIGAALHVVIQQSQIAIVVEDLGVIDGLKRGWEVFRANLLPYLVMWLILNLGVGLLAGIVLMLPLGIALIPLIVSMITTQTLELNVLTIASLVCVAGYLPVLIVLGGALTAYIHSAWTLTFLRLTGRRMEEVIVPPTSEVEPEAGEDLLPA